MTGNIKTAPGLASQLVNGVLAIKPLADLARNRARAMMIKRAETIGVYWQQEVQTLRARGGSEDLAPLWETELAQMQNPKLTYPDYYLRTFHAYDQGNLSWESAMEVEVAARAVHARIWPEAGAAGDAKLRQSYHDLLKAQIPDPKDILDLGCSVGMSTFALQAVYPQAQITGIDLSPYFLAIAQYRSQRMFEKCSLLPDDSRGVAFGPNFSVDPGGDLPNATPLRGSPTWLHAPAEATGLPDRSFDLISAFLLFHELPREAAIAVFREAKRLLKPGGHLALMDMNPQSEVHAKMPPYILTLLKSTEPHLDDYFTFDIEAAIESVGLSRPTLTCNSPRHRTLIAQLA
jgi:SAM-dependent methyltransferase